MQSHLTHALLAAAALSLVAAPALAIDPITETFDSGTGGWSGPQGATGSTFVDGTAGSPAPSLHTQFIDFGITFRNTSPEWTGDYTANGAFSFTVDFLSTAVEGLNGPVGRDLVIEFRDFDNVNAGYPYVSVWTDVADITTNSVNGQSGWTTVGVTVDDPTQTSLPDGWGGYGDEDPDTFEPILPANRTFADVLASVDEIVITTYKPGFFYTSNQYDLSIDNPTVSLVPEPGSLSLLGLGALLLRRRR